MDRFFSPTETRAVVVDFSLYNVNVNTFAIVRLTFEVLETGEPSHLPLASPMPDTHT